MRNAQYFLSCRILGSLGCDGDHRHRETRVSLVMVMQRQRRHHHLMSSVFVCSIDAATSARSTFGCSLSMITSIWFVLIGTSIASLSADVLASSFLLSMLAIFLIYAGVTDGVAQAFELRPMAR